MTTEQENIMKEILREQQKVNVRVQRVERVLIGDREYGVKGLVDRVDGQGKQIHKLNSNEIKRTAIMTGVAIASSFFVTYIKDFFIGHK